MGDTEVTLNLNVTAPRRHHNFDGYTGAHEVPLKRNVHDEQNAENVLEGLVGDREVPINVIVKEQQDAERPQRVGQPPGRVHPGARDRG